MNCTVQSSPESIMDTVYPGNMTPETKAGIGYYAKFIRTTLGCLNPPSSHHPLHGVPPAEAMNSRAARTHWDRQR